MKVIEQIHTGMMRSLSIICALIFATLVIDVLFGVFTRQVLNAQPAWTEELARFLLVWLALLGGVLAYGSDHHLGVDVLVSRLQPVDQRIALIISHLVALGFSIAVLVVGGSALFHDRWESGQMLPTLGIRKAWFYLVLPLGGLLISLLAVGKILGSMQPAQTKEGSA